MAFYLKIGDCLVEDNSTNTGYTVTGHPSLPEPEPDGYGGHLPAIRQFSIYAKGATSSAANYKANALRQNCAKDETLYFRHGTTGTILECRIRDAHVVEGEYAPFLRDSMGIRLDLTLTTDPYWLGAWTDEVSASASVTTVPGHFDISDPGGEVDALLTVRVVPSAAHSGILIGVKPNPDASFNYLDDYQGTADTNALTGQKQQVSAATSSGNTYPSTTFNLTTSSNSGTYLALIRMDSTSSAAASNNVRVYAVTYGIASTTGAFIGSRTVFKSTDLTGFEAGTIKIPGGKAPSSSGYTTRVIPDIWCSSAAQILSIDYLQRIPSDYACIVFRSSASGVLYDAADDTIYVAGASGIGLAAFSVSEIRRPLRARPGVTNRVVIGILQTDSVVAGTTHLSYKVRPRYLSATG